MSNELNPNKIADYRNTFLNKATVERTNKKALEDRATNSFVASDVADLSGSKVVKDSKDSKESKSASTTGGPNAGATTTSAPESAVKEEKGSTSATKPEGAASATESASGGTQLSLPFDAGTAGAGLATKPEGGSSAQPVVADPTQALTQDPNLPPQPGLPQPVPGQPNQTEYMQRVQLVENDANAARTIYAQMAADRQKAFFKMLEILQSARQSMYDTLQGIMVNKAKSTQVGNAAFQKYMQM